MYAIQNNNIKKKTNKGWDVTGRPLAKVDVTKDKRVERRCGDVGWGRERESFGRIFMWSTHAKMH